MTKSVKYFRGVVKDAEKDIKVYEARSHDRQLRALERKARQPGFVLQDAA